MGLLETKYHFDDPEMNIPVKVLDLIVDGKVATRNFYCYVLETDQEVASAIEEVSQFIEVGQALAVRNTTRVNLFNENIVK